MKKIFGIGLSRTGTTSLALALKQNGINIVHYPNESKLFDPKSDGACDIPAAVHYKELDKKFPNSKFIYTTRDKDDWLISIEKYLKRKEHRIIGPWQTQNRVALYGQMKFDKDLYASKYDAHDNNVRSYFKEREQDLLVLDICDGANLKMLLDFLDVSGEDGPFPHENKRRAT